MSQTWLVYLSTGWRPKYGRWAPHLHSSWDMTIFTFYRVVMHSLVKVWKWSTGTTESELSIASQLQSVIPLGLLIVTCVNCLSRLVLWQQDSQELNSWPLDYEVQFSDCCTNTGRSMLTVLYNTRILFLTDELLLSFVMLIRQKKTKRHTNDLRLHWRWESHGGKPRKVL